MKSKKSAHFGDEVAGRDTDGEGDVIKEDVDKYTANEVTHDFVWMRYVRIISRNL